ncbi:MAG: DUF2752 domain-containing protein [Ignavibacterium sp.]|jgi:hypothetical protein|nr:DUF2752 domain-containing protein [Ignavibacterium sp.]
MQNNTKEHSLILFFHKSINSLKLIGIEVIVWISALLYLAFFNDPFNQHFTICPLANLGFEHCPGCGLGNSISLLFHGYFLESFYTHLLGLPAILIILYRIFSLIHFNYKSTKSTTKSRSSYA